MTIKLVILTKQTLDGTDSFEILVYVHFDCVMYFLHLTSDVLNCYVHETSLGGLCNIIMLPLKDG